MVSEPNDHELPESGLPYADYREVLASLSNADLLSALDLGLLELEKRLLHYSHVGPELVQMADEGLVLSVRARARLGQALSSAQHAEGHLQIQIVGVGECNPGSTLPWWNTEPRLNQEDE